MAKITGTNSSDQLSVNPSEDPLAVVDALLGDDVIYIRGSSYSPSSRPTIFGGDGSDTISFAYFSKAVYAAILGTSVYPDPKPGQFVAFSSIPWQHSIENLTGSNYGDFLAGDNNANVLEGRGGSDELWGNGGKDKLIGGAGADTFVFKGVQLGSGVPVTDSTVSNPDLLTDFQRGIDKIDLTRFPNMLISGTKSASYTEHFRWAGKLSSNNVTMGYAGYRTTATGVDLLANPYGANGDVIADLRVSLSGVTALSSSDVLL